MEGKKNDLHRGNSVKLTDGYRLDYRQRNTFLSTFWPVPGTMQSHVPLYKIFKSRENETLPQRIHSSSGDNLATNSHLLQTTNVPNKTNISNSTGSTPRMGKQRKWGTTLQGYTNRGCPNYGPPVTHQLMFCCPWLHLQITMYHKKKVQNTTVG